MLHSDLSLALLASRPVCRNSCRYADYTRLLLFCRTASQSKERTWSMTLRGFSWPWRWWAFFLSHAKSEWHTHTHLQKVKKLNKMIFTVPRSQICWAEKKVFSRLNTVLINMSFALRHLRLVGHHILMSSSPPVSTREFKFFLSLFQSKLYS